MSCKTLNYVGNGVINGLCETKIETKKGIGQGQGFSDRAVTQNKGETEVWMDGSPSSPMPGLPCPGLRE